MSDPVSSAPPPLSPPVRVTLHITDPAPCPYLPGRESISRGLLCSRIPGELYHAFMDAGFRRSGPFIYQPICAACRKCRPIRVPVATFKPSKSQRRCARANADLKVRINRPEPTEEKHKLYTRYLAARHNGSMSESWDDFVHFLYDSPVDTIEFMYRDFAGRLLAVGLCDICPLSLSSVYFYFDPDFPRRGLGIFGALTEISAAREFSIPHYYLGFHVAGCRAMEYKAEFRPCEILDVHGQWRPWTVAQQLP